MSRRFAGGEQLEGRHMMAVVASFTDNQLSIIGDAAADTVAISTVDFGGVAQVTVNGRGVGAGVNASDVTSIFANLGGGNDTMDLSTFDLSKFSGLTDGSIEIRGGAGNDTLVGSPLGDILKGEDGNDTLNGGAGNDQLIGGKGNDTLIGGAGDDILDGGLNDDIYSFSGSTDLGSDTVIQAASGNLDTLGFGSFGGAIVIDISMTTPQVVRAGLLTLTLSDGAGIDNVQGTAYDDVILGNAGGNSLMGNGGNDYLWGRGGNDWLDGGAGNDTLYGGDGNDTLLGKGGNDSLYGHAGNDTLNGNEGNDYLSGDEGDDTYIVTNYGTKTIGASAASDNDWLDLAGNAPAAALDLSSTSVQAVATSLWVRFTEADAVSWVPGAGDNGKHAGELYDGGYYTVPGVEGTTTTLSFTYGGAVAAYHNPVYVYNADALQPGQHPSGEYLFTGNETAEGTVVPKSYPAGTTLGFYILQDGVDGFNGEARTRFYSENARNTKDENAEQRQHVRAYDLSPTVLQLSWEDLFYVLPNPGGYRDTDFNDLWMGIEAVEFTAVDLDVDSDNSGQIERSEQEESLEVSVGEPGVLLGAQREPLVVTVWPGEIASLILSDGADKVTIWTEATGGSMVLSAAEPLLDLAAAAGAAATEWTFWIEAIAASGSDGDISISLVPAGESATSPLADTVRATSLVNHAPEFQSEETSSDTGEDFYSFSITSDLVGALGTVEATDEDGDVLEYSGESEQFVVTSEGAIETRPGVMLIPGTYEIRVMAQDPRGEFDFADVAILVTAPDFGFTLTGVENAVEGADVGRFQIWRSDASLALNVVLELVAAPVTVPVGLDDFVITRASEALFGPFFTIHFDPGEHSADLMVTAFEDSLPELIEDLSLRVYSYTVGPVTVPAAAFNVLATVMLFDAAIPDGVFWQQMGNEPYYRAVKDGADLITLAMMVSTVEQDWTTIWPKEGSDLGRWRKDVDYSKSPQPGAIADVSNLTATNGKRIVLFGFDELPGANHAFVKNSQEFFKDYMKEKDADGKRRTVELNVGSPEKLAGTLKRISSQGKTPISEFLFVAHWSAEPVAAENVPDRFVNWDGRPPVPENVNTFAEARLGHGPVRGWFTRNASLRFFGCNTDGVVDRWATEFLRIGATSYGTNAVAVAYSKPVAAGFDLDGDGQVNTPALGEVRWTTAEDLFNNKDRWVEHGGGQ